MAYCTLENLPVAKEDPDSLRTTVEAIKRILLQSGSFQHGIDQRAIMTIVQEKFPCNVIHRVDEIRLQRDKKWNLDRMLEILYHIIKIKETAGHDIKERNRKLNEECRFSELQTTFF